MKTRSGMFSFDVLYFTIYGEYYRISFLRQLTFYLISNILFSDDAFQ
jgi:hypothetical protein